MSSNTAKIYFLIFLKTHNRKLSTEKHSKLETNSKTNRSVHFKAKSLSVAFNFPIAIIGCWDLVSIKVE